MLTGRETCKSALRVWSRRNDNFPIICGVQDTATKIKAITLVTLCQIIFTRPRDLLWPFKFQLTAGKLGSSRVISFGKCIRIFTEIIIGKLKQYLGVPKKEMRYSI